MKKIITIIIITLFLNICLPQTGNADALEKQLEIAFTDNSGYRFYNQIIISPDRLLQFNNNFSEWENTVKEFDLDNKMDTSEILTFLEITNSLVNELKELTYDPNTGIYYFPEPLLQDGAILQFIKTHLLINENSTGSAPLPSHLHLNRVFTIGRGLAWLPFTHFDDLFIGFRFLPIFLHYSFGYGKSKWINVFPPAICIKDRLGIFNLISIGFVGLYINFGERSFYRPPGLVVLIGAQTWSRLSEDIP